MRATEKWARVGEDVLAVEFAGFSDSSTTWHWMVTGAGRPIWEGSLEGITVLFDVHDALRSIATLLYYASDEDDGSSRFSVPLQAWAREHDDELSHLSLARHPSEE